MRLWSGRDLFRSGRLAARQRSVGDHDDEFGLRADRLPDRGLDWRDARALCLQAAGQQPCLLGVAWRVEDLVGGWWCTAEIADVDHADVLAREVESKAVGGVSGFTGVKDCNGCGRDRLRS